LNVNTRSWILALGKLVLRRMVHMAENIGKETRDGSLNLKRRLARTLAPPITLMPDPSPGTSLQSSAHGVRRAEDGPSVRWNGVPA
jgi:hypothetical protein